MYFLHFIKVTIKQLRVLQCECIKIAFGTIIFLAQTRINSEHQKQQYLVGCNSFLWRKENISPSKYLPEQKK